MANKDISFCMNRKCTKTDCLRFYANAPFNTILSWINPKSDKDGKCEEYWPGVDNGKSKTKTKTSTS